ncbi:MAG: hypothetical protein JKX84_03240 [Flavobacteriales bacterium]|nr:hypothetical protein [Flavobacteriales bacterium]
MKTRILQILGVAAIATLGMTSCDTDACKDVDCGANGTCLEGDCICDLGYEGTNCATLVNASFTGSFNITESCTSGPDQYAITVTAPTATTVNINNLYDASLNVTGTINADGGVTIASQTFGSGTISGSITETGGVLTIVYTFTDSSGSPDTCTMTAS